MSASRDFWTGLDQFWTCAGPFGPLLVRVWTCAGPVLARMRSEELPVPVLLSVDARCRGAAGLPLAHRARAGRGAPCTRSRAGSRALVERLGRRRRRGARARAGERGLGRRGRTRGTHAASAGRWSRSPPPRSGLLLPAWYFQQRAERRRAEVEEAVGEAVEALRDAVRIGLGIEEALRALGRTGPAGAAPGLPWRSSATSGCPASKRRSGARASGWPSRSSTRSRSRCSPPTASAAATWRRCSTG